MAPALPRHLPLLLAVSLLLVAPGLVGQASGRQIARILDDPHFTSPDGVPYDFHGELDKVFCITTDERFHVNALLKGYKDKRPFGFSAPDAEGFKKRTWMKEMTFFWKDTKGLPHNFYLAVRVSKEADRGKGYLAKVELDGVPMKTFYDGKMVEKDGFHFKYIGIEKQENPPEDQEHFLVSVDNEFQGVIVIRPANPQLRASNDAEVHLNLNFEFLNNTDHVHGVMGQTYRSSQQQLAKSTRFLKVSIEQGKPIQADQESGKGFLDGEIQDYISSDVRKPDCKFSQFHLEQNSTAPALP